MLFEPDKVKSCEYMANVFSYQKVFKMLWEYNMKYCFMF